MEQKNSAGWKTSVSRNNLQPVPPPARSMWMPGPWPRRWPRGISRGRGDRQEDAAFSRDYQPHLRSALPGGVQARRSRGGHSHPGPEKACRDWATDQPPSLTPLPAKKKCLAVVGGGLSGLTAAFDLARKGYQVTVFEKEPRLGGSLWHLSEADLPREVMAANWKPWPNSHHRPPGDNPERGTSLGRSLPGIVAVYLAPGGKSAGHPGWPWIIRGCRPHTRITSRHQPGGSLPGAACGWGRNTPPSRPW